MLIHGVCHCGNIAFDLAWDPNPVEIPARACGCSFCMKHGGVWTAYSKGSLRVRVREWGLVSKYEFGTKTAEFHVCTRCGSVPVVTSKIEGGLYAVVNVNTFEGLDPSLLRRSAVDFDGEEKDDRLARRKRGWIADVRLVGSLRSQPPGGATPRS
jgi:hypothetical protein